MSDSIKSRSALEHLVEQSETKNSLGLIVSVVLHVVIIGFGIFTIAGSKFDRHEIDIEPIAIDLAPIADDMALREGDQALSAQEKPAPKPTQKPEINNQANHVGDGQIDSATPLRPELRLREVEVTPPPTGGTQVEAANTPPVSADSVASQQSAETVDDIVESAPIIPPLPQNVPPPKQKPQRQLAVSTPPVRMPSENQESLEDILEKTAVLIDRTPTQGGGMRRSEQPAGAGATRNIGDGELRQTIQNVIGGCIKNTANIGILQGSGSYDIVVRVHMRLNRDGSIDGVPDLTPSGGDASEREIAVTQGHAALARCAPFNGLPPERYDDGWFDITFNWRPLD